ncbi:MAG: hypothetical protein FJ148_04810 [Deltaproteobacteria bacterium]|nr:hypothetical protein [Deltaproteobacteria bacterium]
MLHDPTIFKIVAPRANPTRAHDALVQTYFWRGDVAYSRYPPGFPALLAVAGLIGGEAAQHALNPLLYLVMLALVGWLTWALVAPRDRLLAAGAAATAMWLVLVLPTDVHLWGITVARDLPAHVLGLLAVLAAVARRHVWSGLALGLACTIRPDAILYAASLAAVLWVDGVRLRALLLGIGAFLAGASPLAAYNTLTGGHPFAFTQAGEFTELLSRLLSPAAAHARTIVFDSGGAFRLANLRETLPASLALLGRAFGGTALLVALGAVWAARVRRPMVAALLPYPLLAVPFYACWSHADARYLTGAALCLIPLAATGATLACRWLADAARSGVWRWLVLVAVVLGVVGSGGFAFVGAAFRALLVAFAAAVVLGSVPRIAVALRSSAALAPAVALLSLVVLRILEGSGARDPFQAPQVARARATLGALVPLDGVVITSEALGRPAENVAHYLGVPAFYASELPLLRTDQQRAALLLAMAGRRPFFLVADEQAASLAPLRTSAGLRVVARRRGDAVLDWFVDPRRGGGGVVLYELVLSLEQRALLRNFKGHVEGEL